MTEHPRAIDQVRRTLVAGLAATPVLPATVGVTAATAPSAQANSTSAVRIVVFDVNETLLDLGTLAPVFVRIFGDAGALRTWFNQVVLYSEALTLSGDYADAGTVGVTVLRMMAQASGRAVTDPDLDDLKHLSGTMPTYADTPKALGALRAAGYRLVTLSNTPTVAVDAQLAHAGIRSYFDAVHSIDDRVRRYKPARESYADLAVALGVAPSDLWLVSCHAFDTLGAAAAGYRTALVLRPGNAPVALGRAPDIVAEDLAILADHLVHADTRATGAK